MESQSSLPQRCFKRNKDCRMKKYRNPVRLAMFGAAMGMLLSIGVDIKTTLREVIFPAQLRTKTTVLQQRTGSCGQLEKTIFFIEIEGNRCLTRTQLCSVESAALVNPSARVVIYVNKKPFSQILWDQRFTTNHRLRNCLDTEYLMLSYKNIRREMIDVEETITNSPLKTLWNSGSLANSLWPEIHLRDVLSWALIRQHGGYYLDFNVLSLKPIDCLSSFAVLRGITLDPSAFGFEKDHGFTSFLIRYLNRVFRPEDITATGSPPLTSAISMYCSLNVLEAGIHSCYKDHRIEILPPTALFPVQDHEMSSFFHSDLFNLTRLNSTFGIRLQELHWNSFIQPTSTYAQVTEQFCPWVSRNIPLHSS